VVNFGEIPAGKLGCWRSLLREAGGEKVNSINASKLLHNFFSIFLGPLAFLVHKIN
jgi:hypothetical protein